ncbi:MAG: hypothetical protein ISR73_11225 [Gammaproteobacteria bacterium]|nr:hypothetical protein [Gammaproteobacteria bacterium]
MSQLFNFRGAATAGLFVYLTIYAGMLGYATVAFDEKPESMISQQQPPSVVVPVVAQAPALATAGEVDVIPAQVQPALEPMQQSPAGMAPVISAVTEPPANIGSVAVSPVVVQNSVPESMISGFVRPANDTDFTARLASAQAQQLQSMQQYAHYHAGNSRANGRGKGSMNGDGDFSFSMKFKSRAKMNADADMDSALQNAYYADQQLNYWQQYAAQPSYQYYYQ